MLYAQISTLFIWLPILLGLLNWWEQEKVEGYLRLFLIFLLVGFTVDGLGWHLYQYYLGMIDGWVSFAYYEPIRFAVDIVKRSYGLFEGLCFLWFVSIGSDLKVRQLARWAMISIIPVWIFFEVLLPYNIIDYVLTYKIAYYQAAYRILVSFLGGYALLKGIENDLLKVRHFKSWLLVAVFTYNLGTFFIMILQRTTLAPRFWYLHNTLNMLTYIIYSLGLIYEIRLLRSARN